ncbi:MAG: hypothetical protein LBN33_07680 [Desulfovibrio sp.]|jgi:hypothetical protein|nr:hypothetical protein [Desulfovibrio sp.]
MPENPGLFVLPRKSIVLDTRNRGKIGELAVLLRPFGWPEFWEKWLNRG